jgi:uncharacterized protein YcbK (DUF882 family)
MITLKELNPHGYETTPEIDANLSTLKDRLERLQLAYNKPFLITSGLRSMEQQKSLISQGKSNAPKSKHLIGAAADILDRGGKLYDFCKANPKLLESIGLWCEERMGPWQHMQILPPKSGKRWFFP